MAATRPMRDEPSEASEFAADLLAVRQAARRWRHGVPATWQAAAGNDALLDAVTTASRHERLRGVIVMGLASAAFGWMAYESGSFFAGALAVVVLAVFAIQALPVPRVERGASGSLRIRYPGGHTRDVPLSDVQLGVSRGRMSISSCVWLRLRADTDDPLDLIPFDC